MAVCCLLLIDLPQGVERRLALRPGPPADRNTFFDQPGPGIYLAAIQAGLFINIYIHQGLRTAQPIDQVVEQGQVIVGVDEIDLFQTNAGFAELN